ncbi:DUF4292 domain-containing protein [Mucilaginibacter sp. JRF]|uniref:DUF4292 domain-containing protein n=1 Tax=Mucilaginibacter sp. JRF TaxID=2780088 RepID=UPI0018824820|nr:DUF4292 domain-containing protein [Mucilaginibacter sp. JRF]MBE9585328.1 DUF4292 domain-containing protein [Mucilaginibacter sp. JRF]
MKKNTWNKILLVSLGLIVFASCKSKKQVVVNRNATTAVKPASDVEARLTAIRAKQLTFNTFSAKAKTQLNINGNNQDVTLNIRINRDKKIWVSVTAILGVEVARALITPDSIQVVNKFQGVYLKKPFNYIHKFASKQIDYTTLQSLLVGNAIPKLLNDSITFEASAPNITGSGKLDELVYKLVLGADMRVTQTTLANQQLQQSLQVTNNTFIQTPDNKVVPSQIDIASVVKKQKIQVNLRYNKVEFDQQLDYPFSIPDKYSPAAE